MCSGFTSIAEVGEQCPVEELRCGRGRSGATPPSQGQGPPGFAANDTVAEAPNVSAGVFGRSSSTEGASSFVARAHRSRGVLGQPARGLVGIVAARRGSREPGSIRDLPAARSIGRESRSRKLTSGSKWVTRRDPQHPPVRVSPTGNRREARVLIFDKWVARSRSTGPRSGLASARSQRPGRARARPRELSTEPRGVVRELVRSATRP